MSCTSTTNMVMCFQCPEYFRHKTSPCWIIHGFVSLWDLFDKTTLKLTARSQTTQWKSFRKDNTEVDSKASNNAMKVFSKRQHWSWQQGLKQHNESLFNKTTLKLTARPQTTQWKSFRKDNTEVDSKASNNAMKVLSKRQHWSWQQGLKQSNERLFNKTTLKLAARPQTTQWKSFRKDNTEVGSKASNNAMKDFLKRQHWSRQQGLKQCNESLFNKITLKLTARPQTTQWKSFPKDNTEIGSKASNNAMKVFSTRQHWSWQQGLKQRNESLFEKTTLKLAARPQTTQWKSFQQDNTEVGSKASNNAMKVFSTRQHWSWQQGLKQRNEVPMLFKSHQHLQALQMWDVPQQRASANCTAGTFGLFSTWNVLSLLGKNEILEELTLAYMSSRACWDGFSPMGGYCDITGDLWGDSLPAK